MSALVSSAKTSALSQVAYDRFAELKPSGNQVVATYIWIDSINNQLTKSKAKILDFKPTDVSQLPMWDFCTPKDPNNFHGLLIENYLKPVGIYRDPLLRGDNILVLCDSYDTIDKPAVSNHRYSCNQVMEKAKDFHPWFGIEQEYFLVDVDGEPLGWPRRGIPRQGLGPSHCGTGGSRVMGRHIADSHLRACLYAGLKIDGANAEAMLSQWEFQVGPCEGIQVGDHLWVARYLLQRIAEEFGVDVSMDPKIVADESLIGTGAHCNFSTAAMRSKETGIKAMEDACRKLEKRHLEHLQKYDLKGGEDNKRRLNEDARSRFSWGIGTRETSVRIPGRCHMNGSGYIEDRRPAGNADPYIVTEMIVRTTLLDE